VSPSASVVSLALVLLACTRAKDPGEEAGAADAQHSDAAVGTPVRVAKAQRTTLTETVSGPGRTDALEQQKVRAPFKGILRELRVIDGDRVKKGQIVAVLISQESQAALTGAEALVRTARTSGERSDAQRALELARRGLVPAYLRAPETGVIVSHGADEGSLVAESQDIVSMAASGSFFFRADMAQTELPRVHQGEPAEVQLAAKSVTLPGKVHSILPAASATDLTVPVRIDFEPGNAPQALALFGTATVTVGTREGVIAVPASAVLRDDVSGVTRIAAVSQGKAHWLRVTTGIAQQGLVEIREPQLPPGTIVIVDGQVGLEEDAPVQVEP
jgi:membrane fusion protein, multidrug efflux system